MNERIKKKSLRSKRMKIIRSCFFVCFLDLIKLGYQTISFADLMKKGEKIREEKN